MAHGNSVLHTQCMVTSYNLCSFKILTISYTIYSTSVINTDSKREISFPIFPFLVNFDAYISNSNFGLYGFLMLNYLNKTAYFKKGRFFSFDFTSVAK